MILGTAKKRAPEGQPVAGWWRRYWGLAIDGLLSLIVGSLAALAITGVALDALVDAFNKTKEQASGKAAILLEKLQNGQVPDPQSALDTKVGQQIGQAFANNLALNPAQWAVLIAAILLFVLFVFYNNIMRVHTKGRTLGDQLVGIYKIRANTSWLSWGQAFLRYLILLALAWGSGIGGNGTNAVLTAIGAVFGVLYIVNFALPLFDNRGQTLNDKIVRSYVVHPDRFGVAMHAQQPASPDEAEWPGAGVYEGIENENPYVAPYQTGVAGQPPASVAAGAAGVAAGGAAVAGTADSLTPDVPGGFAPPESPTGEAVNLPTGPASSATADQEHATSELNVADAGEADSNPTTVIPTGSADAGDSGGSASSGSPDSAAK